MMVQFGFRKFRIGALFGIPVYLDWSTIFLALMFLQSGSVVFAFGLAAVLLASIVLHELGHSLTARCFGCETRDITLTVIGGCASLERMPRKAWQEFLTAAAGPLVSFALGVALYVVSSFLPAGNMLGDVLWCGGHINIGLGLFNLLPGFPMDGGRIFRSVLRLVFTRARATYAAMVVGRVFAVLLALWGVHAIFQGSWGWIKLLIAWMIWREGWREYMMAVQEDRWGSPWEFSARVSPPPYSNAREEEVEVRRR